MFARSCKHPIMVDVVAISCVEGWCCVLAWCPFYSLGVAAALCTQSHQQNSLCVDPAVWSLLSWLGYTTSAVVPLIWLSADAWLKAQARRLVCSCDNGGGDRAVMEMKLDEHWGTSTTTGSTISTQFTTVERLPVPRHLK